MPDYNELHRLLLPILSHISALLPSPQAGMVLDLACGQGDKIGLIAEGIGERVRLLGIDIDAAVLRAVDHGRCWCVAGNAGALPLRKSSCAAVYCIAALGLFADQNTALREIRRVLQPGGWALIVTATQAWCPVVRWPRQLSKRLSELYLAALAARFPSHGVPPMPAIANELYEALRQSQFVAPWIRTFLLEDAMHPVQVELPILPWPVLCDLIGEHLRVDERRYCERLVSQAEIELCTITLAAVATA